VTWSFRTSHLRLALRWASTAVIAALILGSVGALALPPPKGPGQVEAPCAHTVATALSTPQRPVAGSWDCLSLMQQLQAVGAGFNGDEGLRQFSQTMGRDQMRYLGATGDGGFVYELTGTNGGPALVMIWVDSTGHVVAIHTDSPQ